MSLFEKLKFRKSGKNRDVDAKIAADLALMKATPIPREGMETTLAEIQRLQRMGTQEEFSVPRERIVFSRAVQRAFQSVVGTAGALVMLGGGWLYFADQTPDIKPVMQTLPMHNGYDTLIAATKLLPKEEECTKWLKREDTGKGKLNALPETAEQKKLDGEEGKFLKRCEPAFEMAMKSVELKGFVIPAPVTLETLSPDLVHIRQLADLLQIRSKREALQGHYEVAFRSEGKIIELATRVEKGGNLLSFYTGISIETVALKRLQSLLPHLSSEQLWESETILMTDPQETQLARDVLSREKSEMINALASLFAKPKWREEFQRLLRTQFGTYLDPGTQQDDFATKLALYTVNKKWAVKNYTHYMDIAITRADRLDSWKMEDPTLPFDLVVRWVTPSVKPAFFAQARLLTLRHLVRCAYNLQIYYARNGYYPDQLKHITSDPALWSDPFADNSKGWKPLRYKRDGKGYLLYSVGPDGKDDGGKPLVNPNTHQPLKDPAQLTETSLGDIVFRNR